MQNFFISLLPKEQLENCFPAKLTKKNPQFTFPQGKVQEGVYNHWQQSMMTEDPSEAEAIARSKGLRTEWGPNRLLKTKFYADAFEYFGGLDRNILFSSLADDAMWFDSWPLVQHLPNEERPLKLTYGDDTELTREEKKTWIEAYDRCAIEQKKHVQEAKGKTQKYKK